MRPAHGHAGERICLFGGTFDPIHKAHLAIAREAVKAYHLDRVLFIPAAHPPHKQPSQIAPFEHRYRMVELACEGYAKFQASRLEAGEGVNYSIDTAERLRAECGAGAELFFLIGSDAFDEIQTWHRWKDLVRLVRFIVVSRPGHDFPVAPGADVQRMEELALPVSSTGIRDRLALGGPTPELPASVRQYIEEHHLYGAAERQSNVGDMATET